jgi:hypothetical protein
MDPTFLLGGIQAMITPGKITHHNDRKEKNVPGDVCDPYGHYWGI